jgi:putative ABC transport system ATP-binding protein
MVPVEELRPALKRLDDRETTIIVFTCRPDAFEFDHMLWLGRDSQLLTQDRAAFAAARNAAKARNSAEGGFHALPR